MKRIQGISTITQDTAHSLSKILETNKVVAHGDTRFQRVLQRKEIHLQSEQSKLRETFGAEGAKFLEKHQGAWFVAGSTWPEDHQLLIEALAKDGLSSDEAIQSKLKGWIIVPHEISHEGIQALKSLLTKHHLSHFTVDEWNEILHKKNSTDGMPDGMFLIVDRVGILAELYSLGRIAYVGGGFSQGLHNTLEPLAWNIPVICGPSKGRFPEVKKMISLGLGEEIKDKQEFSRHFSRWLSESESDRNKRLETGRSWFDQQLRIASKTMDWVDHEIS